MKTNIPIYRAKKINSDEYVEGDLITTEDQMNIISSKFWDKRTLLSIKHKVDPSTLAIHFPDMIDSEGTKIFASLSGDGKGGDNIIHKNYTSNHYKVKFVNSELGLNIIPINGDMSKFTAPLSYAKVTGIQE